ncbi:MAG TPA: type IV secretory system conjugative DNA transfer family protein [Thermomicrobiales bacterium]|nr:type IV secretory system conjugative DNA transfer family protein [Thermomicrobiales bacterium]
MPPLSRRTPPPATHLIEVVTPRTNGATLGAAENLLAALALAEPFALELAATAASRRFLVRAGTEELARHLAAQLGAVYPQATLRPLTGDPAEDPAHIGAGERARACRLALRAPAYVPLRPFRDADVDAARAAQADPLLGVLGALGGLPPGWRALGQLVLAPAPDDWGRRYRHLAREAAPAGRAGPSPAGVLLPAALCAALALGWQAYTWYDAGAWLPLALVAAGGLLAPPALLRLAGRVSARGGFDPRLVAEKLARPAFVAQLRLAVVAPADAPARAVAARLARLAAAYRPFTLASGNGLAPRPLPLAGRDLRALAPLPSRRAAAPLTTRELAALWHLPQAGADVPLVERTAARRRLPPVAAVAAGCPIGRAVQQAVAVPVAVPHGTVAGNLLLVAKTRHGKSSLLLHFARYLMAAEGSGSERRALILVDPHEDLARAALGLVPPARRGDVVALDLADEARPVGLNLLDAGLGWTRDQAVANALTVFRQEFTRFWGPRMADAFRFALLTLAEANAALCAADPAGRRRQYTALDVRPLLTEPAFRRAALALVADPHVIDWWAGYFDALDRRTQLEIVNPVLTKVNAFAGSRVARALVGQPRSTIDPAAWVREGAIVVVNAARGPVGEETAALVGGTLINLVALAVGAQSRLAPAERRPVTVIVDELQTMPGADYEALLAELGKFGANLILATQGLGQLATLDQPGERALTATVFANLDGLFAFHVGAEDARRLVPELGGEEVVGVADLVGLGKYQCYAALAAGRERVPAFLVQLDPPPTSDPALAAALAAASAQRWGRARAAVEEDLRDALTRVARTRSKMRTGQEGDGVARDTTADGPGQPRGKRNSRRPQQDRGRPPHRDTLARTAGTAGAGAGDDAEPAAGAADEGGAGDEGGGGEEVCE